ncbi:hypothetical protein GOBAR_DD04962 [Gossypium barbadense]|nr:hypothetical protein GOBAR_DD04962 [Gossypium barbadense]
MFNRLFGKPKQETSALTTLDKLNETLEMLEKKEKVLLKKAAAEVEKAKEFAKARNKRGMVAIYICYVQISLNIDDVDKTMDEINEQTENMKQIQEALSTPIGAAADFDEDELEAELEELEGAELEEQLLQPATTAPAAPIHVPAGRQPARPIPQKRTAEEDELAALQAEMAL